MARWRMVVVPGRELLLAQGKDYSVMSIPCLRQGWMRV